MSYSINLGEWNDIFVVPKSIITKHLKLVKEDYLKVLLILLSSSPSKVSAQDISDLCGISIENVSDALKYWENCKIIKNSEDCFVPFIDEKNDTSASPAKEIVEKILPKSKTRAQTKTENNITFKSNTPIRPNAFEVSHRIETTEELKWIVSETERLFSRFITPTEAAVLVSMFDYAGLPADVIIMIIEYCVSIDKANLRFIEKTAYSWADKGIDSHQKVSEYIASISAKKDLEDKIKRIFEIWERSLTSKQKEFANIWISEWEISDELLKFAYEKCIDNTSKLSFPYINKILSNWNENGFKTVNDVLNSENSRKQESAEKSSFSLDDLDDITNYKVPTLKKNKKDSAKGN